MGEGAAAWRGAPRRLSASLPAAQGFFGGASLAEVSTHPIEVFSQARLRWHAQASPPIVARIARLTSIVDADRARLRQKIEPLDVIAPLLAAPLAQDLNRRLADVV
jgi:hypothetical protein